MGKKTWNGQMVDNQQQQQAHINLWEDMSDGPYH